VLSELFQLDPDCGAFIAAVQPREVRFGIVILLVTLAADRPDHELEI